VGWAEPAGEFSEEMSHWGQWPIPSNRDSDEVAFLTNRKMKAEQRKLPGESKYPVVSYVFERGTRHLTRHRRACAQPLSKTPLGVRRKPFKSDLS
jgi:hypothetical protein